MNGVAWWSRAGSLCAGMALRAASAVMGRRGEVSILRGCLNRYKEARKTGLNGPVYGINAPPKCEPGPGPEAPAKSHTRQHVVPGCLFYGREAAQVGAIGRVED